MTDIRDEIIDELRKDLLGPRVENEIIEDEAGPTSWYITGILFPKNTGFEPEDVDTLEEGGAGEDEEDQEGQENTIAINRSFKQNSIGISCYLKKGVDRVYLEVQYGFYKKLNDEKSGERKWMRKGITFQQRLELDRKSGDFTAPEGGGKIKWTLDIGEKYHILTVFLYNDNDISHPPKEEVEVYVRKKGDNRQKGDKKTHRDRINQLSIFQPVISLRGEGNGTTPFDSIEFSSNAEVQDEFSSADYTIDLLFRNKRTFAKGFNCAAKWELKAEPSWVSTEIIPLHYGRSVKWSSSSQEKRPRDIDMTDLAYAEKPSDLDGVFASITDNYEKWINSLSGSLDSIGSQEKDQEERHRQLLKTAHEHIDKCKKALERIRNGIRLLQTNRDVFEAFVHANRAMLYQRVRSKYVQDIKKGNVEAGARPEYKIKGVNSWRPFQIAFILMNLKGISDHKSSDREIADLLWFPTGGGKTEAYLGLSAFAIFLRRISLAEQDPTGYGVSVIMRYTLRLLTVQQFQRAAILLCACERIRRDDIKKWGTEPFLIGLWVGKRSTPNSYSEAKKQLRLIQSSGSLAESNPVQITSCPWCGDKITPRNYYADDSRKWIIVHCLNKGCDFYGKMDDVSNALPVLTVDQDIYRRCPAIIIGTVDKFARMPRAPESAAIFGYASRYCESHGFLTAGDHDHPEQSHKKGSIVVQPINELQGPDLIIQDELHLIAGPLGTMVGLYETAVDFLSSRPRGKPQYRPKIIISTATVKGVEYQVKKLFNRKITETFPPPGIDAGDSFFWWEMDEGGRKFVGISCPSISVKTANLRIYAALLQKAEELRAHHPENIDPYWTLVGYFNSKRELGGSLRLLEDDVVRRVKVLTDLVDAHKGLPRREIRNKEELTGRVNSSRIPEILLALEKDVKSSDAIDVLLATNMIAVGVDVDRLGLMVVTGQPKNSAEYIQVVGRVGRKTSAPGLIVTLYNPYKPRDLSHYEDFAGFHSMMQRFVDPVSLTPFSDRAVERGLHAVLIAIVRLMVHEYSLNDGARRFDSDNASIKGIIDAIKQRFLEVEGSVESNDDFIRFSKNLDTLIDWWMGLNQKKSRDLKYTSTFAEREELNLDENVMMIDIGEKNRNAKVTPNSMRDVEKESNLYYYS